MHWAAMNDNLSIVKYLVENGGDANAKDNVVSLVGICYSVILLDALYSWTLKYSLLHVTYMQSFFLISVFPHCYCCSLCWVVDSEWLDAHA